MESGSTITISKLLASEPDLINIDLWVQTQNLISEHLGHSGANQLLWDRRSGFFYYAV